MIYDLIGDIHGFISPLQTLLKKLNYIQINDYLWKPPEDHQAIFIGDYIDRGVSSLAVLKTVRAMTDKGYAIALLGNHEYNAICYHSLKRGHESISTEEDKYLRSHNTKNNGQHYATLIDFARSHEDIKEWVEWFMTLPLFFETNDLIAIHACPLSRYLDAVKKHPDIKENHLTEDFLHKATVKGSLEYDIIENLLKGPEHPLPEELFFEDKDKNHRTEVRLNWWDLNDGSSSISNWNELSLSVPEDAQDKMKKSSISSSETESILSIVEIPSDKLIFIGHYWMTGKVNPMTDQVVCLDYSIGKGGKLVAFSFDENNPESISTFTSVESNLESVNTLKK